MDQTEPLSFPNNANTIVQVANPGPGAVDSGIYNQYGRYENGFYYDPDGGMIFGPPNRPDITILQNSPSGVMIKHTHVVADQPVPSSTRIHPSIKATAFSGGSFGVLDSHGSGYGSSFYIQTGAATAGGGATLEMDFSGGIPQPGMYAVAFCYPDFNGNISIEWGWKGSDGSAAVLQRSEGNVVDNWYAVTQVGSNAPTRVNTNIVGTNARVWLGVKRDPGTGKWTFWIGNYNNTIVFSALVAGDISGGTMLIPTLTFRTTNAVVNRTLYITDFYSIRNG